MEKRDTEVKKGKRKPGERQGTGRESRKTKCWLKKGQNERNVKERKEE